MGVMDTPAVTLGADYLLVATGGQVFTCDTREELEVNLHYWRTHQITGWVYGLKEEESTALDPAIDERYTLIKEKPQAL